LKTANLKNWLEQVIYRSRPSNGPLRMNNRRAKLKHVARRLWNFFAL